MDRGVEACTYCSERSTNLLPSSQTQTLWTGRQAASQCMVATNINSQSFPKSVGSHRPGPLCPGEGRSLGIAGHRLWTLISGTQMPLFTRVRVYESQVVDKSFDLNQSQWMRREGDGGCPRARGSSWDSILGRWSHVWAKVPGPVHVSSFHQILFIKTNLRQN